jgi:tRNA (guanine-N7-)-methyltransferase
MGETQIRREITLGGPLLLTPEKGTLLDWTRVFGRAGPVLVDIGAARARYFLNVGPKIPDVGLVGIEISKKRVERALELLERAGLGARARMVWGNALVVIRDHVAPASVAAFTVLFPDPWPKKKHAERRIYRQPATVALLARRTAPGGLVLVKSDARAYFEGMRDAFAASPCFERSDDLVVRAEGTAPFSLDWPDETRYEEEWKKEGRAIHTAAFRRSAAPPPPPEAEVGIADRGGWRAVPTEAGEEERARRRARSKGEALEAAEEDASPPRGGGAGAGG